MPVASCVAISSILGARLAVRLGTKLIVASGFFSMAAFYLWVATSSVTTSYGTIPAQMVVLGTGMGLTSAPAWVAVLSRSDRAWSVGAALTAAGKLAHAGHPVLASAIHQAASSAFFHGFSAANYVAPGVAGAGAVMALALLPLTRRPVTTTRPRREH